MPLVLESDSDAIVIEAPEVLLKLVAVLLLPFLGQKCHDSFPALHRDQNRRFQMAEFGIMRSLKYQSGHNALP